MFAARLTFISIFTLIFMLNLTAQDTSIEVFVQDSYTEQPLSSALVSVLRHGEVVDSAYTDANGFADIFIPATSVKEPDGLPSTISLSENYPNPFNEETNVEIGVPEAQTITATVYNILGQRVASEQIPVSAGYYTLNMSLGHLATGVYFLRVDGRESETIKLLKMGRGIHPTRPMFSISPSSPPESAIVEKALVDNFTIRVEKQQYELYESSLSIIEETEISIPLNRNNIVEFVVVDEDDESIPKELEIEGADIQETITAPYTMTLKSGVYSVIGEVEEGVSLQETIEVPSVDTTVVLSFQEAGGMLEGKPELPAKEATRSMSTSIVYHDDAIEEDPDLYFDQSILRTEIEIIFDSEVSIGEVNDFLERYDARIVSMLKGNTIFIIRVPDPGSIDMLNQLVEEINNEEIVKYAIKSVIVESPKPVFDSSQRNDIQKIPTHIDSTDYDKIDHHLAVRMHAAWNLSNDIRGLLERPWLLVADGFGDGTPGSGFNAAFTDTDFAVGNKDFHGHHVLGIISGNYVRNPLLTEDQNRVTGVFPNRLRVRVVDLQGLVPHTWSRLMDKIIIRIEEILDIDPDARVVLNTSLGNRNDSVIDALSWIHRVRGINVFNKGAGLEDKFIHFTTAGNIENNQRWPAKENSIFTYAALGDLPVVPNLTNTFVVENRVNTLHDTSYSSRPLPGCANDRSIMGGNISAIGTNVWSFGKCLDIAFGQCIDHASDDITSFQTGTSLSTPQAAGVAAYVWSIDPTLSVNEVMDIIVNTAEDRPTNSLTPGYECNPEIPQPVVDAYAAVLAAGGENARRVLLDVTGNGIFDHNDIEMFINSLQYYDGELNYSRYDLNADGLTGGDGTDRFDLTMNMDYSVVTQTIEGQSVSFDENSLTDLEILCYYAYSDLYEGDEGERSELLAGFCVDDVADWPRDTETEVVEVTNPATGETWMDRNLGASRAATSSTDAQAYGHLYQWGRAADGHQVRTSGTTSTLSNSDTPGHGDFITVNSSPYDWRSPQNHNLWQGVNGINNPCPAGYRLPTEAEWEAERQSWSSNDRAGAFASPLKLPVAGYRNNSNGSLRTVGSRGFYWSSTVAGPYSRALLFSSSSAYLYGGRRAHGYSVRCLKD